MAEQVLLGTRRAEQVCRHPNDQHTPLYIRAIQGYCAVPMFDLLSWHVAQKLIGLRKKFIMWDQ